MFIRTLVGAGGKAVVVVGWLGNAARWAEVLTERDRQVPYLYISRWTDKLNIEYSGCIRLYLGVFSLYVLRTLVLFSSGCMLYGRMF